MSDVPQNQVSDSHELGSDHKNSSQGHMSGSGMSPLANASADPFANNTDANVFANHTTANNTISTASPLQHQQQHQQQSSASVSVHDIFGNDSTHVSGEEINGSSTQDSHNYPAPASPLADKSIVEKLNEDIRKRTAAMDASTKAKETEILNAAKKYLQERTKQFEQDIKTAKANQQKSQKEQESKIEEYKKTGAVWNGVNMLLDLKHPNIYSKNTEHMRGLISSLDSNKATTETAAHEESKTKNFIDNYNKSLISQI